MQIMLTKFVMAHCTCLNMWFDITSSAYCRVACFSMLGMQVQPGPRGSLQSSAFWLHPAAVTFGKYQYRICASHEAGTGEIQYRQGG